MVVEVDVDVVVLVVIGEVGSRVVGLPAAISIRFSCLNFYLF